MTQETPDMDSTLTLGVILTVYCGGIVTGMAALACLDAMGQRARDPEPTTTRDRLDGVDFDAEAFYGWAERGGRN